jgi:hypothetical protein
MIELVAFCAGVDRARVAVDPCLDFCASVTAMTWDLAAEPVYSQGSGAVQGVAANNHEGNLAFTGLGLFD